MESENSNNKMANNEDLDIINDEYELQMLLIENDEKENSVSESKEKSDGEEELDTELNEKSEPELLEEKSVDRIEQESSQQRNEFEITSSSDFSGTCPTCENSMIHYPEDRQWFCSKCESYYPAHASLSFFQSRLMQGLLRFLPVIITAILAFSIGYYNALAGIFAAVILGLFLPILFRKFNKHQSTTKAHSPFDVNMLYHVGNILILLVLLLPISPGGLNLPTFHNPDTYMKYLSVIIVLPENISMATPVAIFPGIPALVVTSIIMILFGSLVPQKYFARKKKFKFQFFGYLLLTLAPYISYAALSGNGQVPFDYGVVYYLGWVGLGLKFVHGLTSKASIAQSQNIQDHEQSPSQPQDPVPTMSFIPIIIPIGSIFFTILSPSHSGGGDTWLGPFEEAHHDLASLLIALICAILGIQISSDTENEEPKNCTLELTYPVGRSPKVFTTGWLFGARCILDAGTSKEQDISDRVEWSGTGTFDPKTGSTSRPSFKGPGPNEIILSCDVGGKILTKKYGINAILNRGYSYLTCQVKCPSDAHGCPACPHTTTGPIISGSPEVFINGQPAARVGDHGVHAACCGPNTFEIIEGDPSVLIDGKPAARKGDATRHCGFSLGTIEQGAI